MNDTSAEKHHGEQTPRTIEHDRKTTDRKDEGKTEDPGMKYFFRIFEYMSRRDVFLSLIGGVCAIGSGTTLPLMALVFGSFITRFTDFGSGLTSPAEFRADINSFTLWFVYLFVAKLVLSYGAGVIFTITALRTTKTIRHQFVKAVLRQEVAYFDRLGPGAVAVKATTNANHINAGISEKLARVIQGAAMIVAALIIAFTRSWKLTLIIIAVAFPLFIVLGITMTIEANVDAKVLQTYSRASDLAEEMLGSIKTVHAFGAHNFLLRRFDEWLLKASSIGYKKSPALAVMFGADYFFSYVPYSMAFWQGARMYLSGELSSVGVLVTVVFAVLMLSNAIAQIAPCTTAFTQASTAASELFEIIDREPLLDVSSNKGEKPGSVSGNIGVHGVSFSYPSRPDIPILQNVSFEAPANKVTALVGASGSGKSTIVSLLERWYDPQAGHLTLDGRSIDTLNVKWLRTQLRLVQQEPVLFNDTIFNNVALGLTGTKYEFADASTKQKLVVEACEAANAVEFIDTLPERYETEVGERAGLLSGGQKQRIAIARSIVSDPRILLLDEATSALDGRSEAVVQNALDRVSKSRTTIVIAHKLTTIMKADNIVVLGHGKVLEEGTHRELIARNGSYAALVNAQNLGSKNDVAVASLDQSDVEKADTFYGDEVVSSGDDNSKQLEASSESSAISTESKDQFKRRNLVQILGTFLGENSQLWPQYLVCLVVSIIGGAVYPAQALIIPRLIVAFELPPEEIQSEVNFFSLMFFVVALVALFNYGVLGWVTNSISQILTRRYRLEMLQSILAQDISFFDKPENAPALLTSRLSTDPGGLQEMIGLNLALVIAILVNLTSSVALAIAFGWKLGLVVASTLPLIFGSGFLRIRLEMKFDEQNSAVFAQSAQYASQAVASMRTVVSLTIEHVICAEYNSRLQGVLQKSYSIVCVSMLWYALAESIEFLVMALAFWYGGQLLSTGEYTTTQFFIIYVAIIFGGEAAGQFFAYTPNITKAHAGGNYILKLRHSHATITESPDAKQPEAGSGYTFDQVRFRYPLRPQVQVLKGLSLDIKPGTSVAFVGGSGSGKSTAIGLLERYYDPTEGSISYGSYPLPHLLLSAYRSCLALVSQEPCLYQGSIRDNIALGSNGEASTERIEQAAKDANILDFIKSLPDGMETRCGTKGTELSGGQRQRIAIARALIRDPSVLLLDEATSALDTTSERLVQEALKHAGKGRTMISVAHRLSTVRDCDEIFVLENGQVVERGNHDQLLALGGSYKKLCEVQSLDQAS